MLAPVIFRHYSNNVHLLLGIRDVFSGCSHGGLRSHVQLYRCIVRVFPKWNTPEARRETSSFPNR